MGHRHHKEVRTLERYSSDSSDSSNAQPASFTPKSVSSTQPNSPNKSAVINPAQNNYGIFQTVQQQNNNQIDQSKEKTMCCECLCGWLFKK